MGSYNTGQGTQPDARGTHAGAAAFNPQIAALAESGTGYPNGAAWAGLVPWLSAGGNASWQTQHMGHSPFLDNRGSWPQRLVGFSAGLHRATVDRATYQQGYHRRGWNPASFADDYHYLNRKRYTNVPVWAILGAPGNVSRSMRNQDSFRRAQPIVKSQALAASLAQNAKAILAARG
jgi:hypothetical protein